MTDGRTLIEAFRDDVLDDSDFVRAIDNASTLRGLRGEASLAWLMRDGLFPSPSALWPVQIDAVDLGLAWFGAGPVVLPSGEVFDGRFDPAPTMDAAEAEATLRRAHELAREVAAVWDRFIAPLRSGAVKATGVPKGNARADVLRSVWQRPATLVDGITGSIACLEDLDEAEIVIEWTAVEFFEDFALNNKTLTDAKRGRPRTVPYEKAMSNVYARIDRDGFPNTGTELCDWLGEGICSTRCRTLTPA